MQNAKCRVQNENKALLTLFILHFALCTLHLFLRNP
jgi:hypothetical protein